VTLDQIKCQKFGNTFTLSPNLT